MKNINNKLGVWMLIAGVLQIVTLVAILMSRFHLIAQWSFVATAANLLLCMFAVSIFWESKNVAEKIKMFFLGFLALISTIIVVLLLRLQYDAAGSIFLHH